VDPTHPPCLRGATEQDAAADRQRRGRSLGLP
jgi:hypothetical protein